MKIESHHNDFIADRSILDSGIYSEDVNCICMCQYYMINRYDLIFYLPCNIPLVDDGFRNLDDIFRLKIDKEFKKYMPIKTIPIMSLSREARVKEIERYL
jgi:nicotinamide riboside kinase